jgi:hypothetical protein
VSTFDPPFAPRTPITARDPSRPLRGVDWQYGFAFRGPHTALQADPPPVISIAAAVATVMVWWTPATWNAQSAPDFTPSGPPPGVPQTPYPNLAQQTQTRAAWPQDGWTAQGFQRNRVQPSTGDEPPGQVTGGAEAPNLQAFGYYDAWRVQSAPPVAALVPAPAISAYLPPNGFPYQALAAWQSLPTWLAQSEPDGASLVPPPVTNQPTPVSTAVFASIRGIWADPTWNTQRPFSPIAPLTLVYGQAPPQYSVASITSLRATWADTTWSAQHALAAPISPPRVDAPAPGSFAMRYALRMAWPDTQWPKQSASTLAPVIPVPIAVTASSGQTTTVYGIASITIRGPDSTTVDG